MSRYVENMNRHVHSRHMVEQDMDWPRNSATTPTILARTRNHCAHGEAATTRPCSTSTATAA